MGYGHVAIVKVDKMDPVLKDRLRCADNINEIKKTSRENEFGFATDNGVYFAIIKKDNRGNFVFSEMSQSILKNWTTPSF